MIARMNLPDLIDQLATIDHEIEELRTRRTLAIKVADFREVNRLQEAIGRLITAQDQLRAQKRRRWWRVSKSTETNRRAPSRTPLPN
jgi:hypothetical protein